jgi:chemotaxis protein MotB
VSDEDDDAPAAGAPLWMATFADLMSLLMCFFVLILSFSEMDVIKYKQIASSMKDAFGVQQDLELTAIPKGTSIVATEFAPGTPEKTPLDDIRQVTTNQDLQSLRIGNPDAEQTDARDVKDVLKVHMQELIQETQDDADMLRRLLRPEIEAGQIDVENENRTIIVRIREKGSFPSGSSVIDIGFMSVLERIGSALEQIKGRIAIEGHTDNVPIGNAAYGSNWDLSAARAVAVTEQMLAITQLPPKRVSVSGFADTHPQADNNTWEGRAQNRRVEIIVKQPLAESQTDIIRELEQNNSEGIEALDVSGSLRGTLQ